MAPRAPAKRSVRSKSAQPAIPTTEAATPIKRPMKIGDEMGVPGIKHWWGRLYEEFLPLLEGDKGRKFYVEMAWNESTIFAFLYAIKMLVRQVDWTVEPVDPSPEEQARADFVEECMNDLDRPWTAFIAEALSSLIHGWQVSEIVLKVRRGAKGAMPSKYDDGKVGWGRFAPRSQETIYRWLLADNGDILGVTQWAPPRYEFVDIPIQKLLHFRTDEWHSSPEGVSILRGCVVPYSIKKTIQMIEAIAIEREGCGLPVARMPAARMQLAAMGAAAGEEGTAAKAEQDALEKLVRDIKTDAQRGIVFPSEFDASGNQLYGLELMSAGGARAINIGDTIMRCRQEMAGAVLADFLLLGQDKVGSFALSSNKTDLFALSTNAIMDGICGVLNRVAVPMLFEVNGESGPYPTIGHGDLESPDLAVLGPFLQQLAGVGIDLTDEPTVDFLRRAAGLPASGSAG